MDKYLFVEKFDINGYGEILKATKYLFEKLNLIGREIKGSSLGGVNGILANEEILAFNVIKCIYEAKKEDAILVALDDNQYRLLDIGFSAYLKNSQIKKEVDGSLGITSEIKRDDYIHIVDVLSSKKNLEAIKHNVKAPFTDFSTYFHISNIIYLDNDRKNKIASIFSAIGLKVSIDNTNCISSGAEFVGIRNDIALKLASKVLESSIDSGADFTSSFDLGDMEMQERNKTYVEHELNRDKLNHPFITPMQLILISFGEKDKDKLGLVKHKSEIGFL